MSNKKKKVLTQPMVLGPNFNLNVGFGYENSPKSLSLIETLKKHYEEEKQR